MRPNPSGAFVADAAPQKAKLHFAAAGPFAIGKRVLAGLAGFFFFVLALQLLKTSARGLGGLLDGIGVDSAWSALGFGWIFAYLVLSGSPVAAIALSLFATDLINAIQTFTMIAGSRFGASFVVLLLGFAYMLRGKSRDRSIEMGVLSLLTTYVVYGIAIPIGAIMLLSGAFDGFRPALPSSVFDAIDLVFQPIVELLAGYFANYVLFLLGVGSILLAFQAFDRAIPDLAEESPIRGLEQHIYRPSVMFGLGCVITLFTLSVSVSLGILVPLSAKGFARRENVIPYIMGANITTFIDTLFATLLLDKPEAFTIVLVEMLSVALVSVCILIFAFSRFERTLLVVSKYLLATRARLTIFVLLVLVTPLILLVL